MEVFVNTRLVIALGAITLASVAACSSAKGAGSGGSASATHASSSSGHATSSGQGGSSGSGGSPHSSSASSASSSSASSSSGSPGAVPTDCAQADGTVGCCTSTGVLYYCDSTNQLLHLTCPSDMPCGWDGQQMYQCVTPPGGADPSQNYPLLCGATTTASSSSTGGMPGVCMVTCNNKFPNHETGCDACIMKHCQAQLDACLADKGSGCIGCSDAWGGGSGINCQETQGLLDALFGCFCKPSACD